jgi:DNA-binding cell septation regulator SpoVG
MFVGMPRERSKDGKWYNRVLLVNEDLKEKLCNMVLSAYDE